MALTSIVGESGDPLSVLTMAQSAGTVTHMMASDGDGEGLVGTVTQGTPTHVIDEGYNGAMLTVPYLRGYPRSRVVNT